MAEASTKKPDFAEIQAELKNPKYDKKNPHYGSGYVSLTALLDEVEPVLNKHGLYLKQDTDFTSAQPLLRTHIKSSPDTIVEEGQVPLMIDGGGAQGVGSALTYAKRQGICALLGIAGEEDDDGAVSEQKPAPSQGRQQPTTKINDNQLRLINVWLGLAVRDDDPPDWKDTVRESFGLSSWKDATKEQMDKLKAVLEDKGRVVFQKDDTGKEVACRPAVGSPPSDDLDPETKEYLANGGDVPMPDDAPW